MTKKIRVGIVGFGTIGKRVADAVIAQPDMELAGIVGRTYNWKIKSAADKGFKIFTVNGELLKAKGIKIAGDIKDMLNEVDIIVDACPKKIGLANKEKYYVPNKIKAIFQGGENSAVADVSFTAQCNYDECLNKDYIRVVSCGTTGLVRTLHEINKKYGINDVYVTLIRRGADSWDIRHGPINAIVPVLELPSHHGPDVRTVLKDINIFTTAVAVSTSLMHVHSVTVECKKKPSTEGAIDMFGKTTRVRMVDNESWVRSTAEIMELAKDYGYARGDMPEICIWNEAVGTHSNKLFFMQAIHQESNVVCENIDAIRAATGFKDGNKSIEITNTALGIPNK